MIIYLLGSILTGCCSRSFNSLAGSTKLEGSAAVKLKILPFGRAHFVHLFVFTKDSVLYLLRPKNKHVVGQTSQNNVENMKFRKLEIFFIPFPLLPMV